MATCTRATPKAEITKESAGPTGPSLSVDVVWQPIDGDLDRPSTCGWLIADDARGRRLATRLVKAIEAGAAAVFDCVATDLNGRSYVQSTPKVFGRTLSADLKRLGY